MRLRGIGVLRYRSDRHPKRGCAGNVSEPLRPQVSLRSGAGITTAMTEGRLDETQEARPSGENPIAARDRLALQWWLAPLLLIAIAALIVLSKLLF